MATYRPAQLAFMHIDVEAGTAVPFGHHWRSIDKCVKRLRCDGAAIIGITYDPDQTARYLPHHDPERRQSLIAANTSDQCFSKNTVSALGQGPSDGRLRNYLRSLPQLGCRAVLLGGYYANQCVLQTARSLIAMQTGMDVYTVADLCRPHPVHASNFDLAEALQADGGMAVNMRHQGSSVDIVPTAPPRSAPTARTSQRARVIS